MYQICTEIISLKKDNFNLENLQNLQRNHLMVLENESENSGKSEIERMTTTPHNNTEDKIVTEEDLNKKI